MLTESTGQDKNKWTEEWKGFSVESEIQMWDFFGLRPWVMKYTPRYGKVVEAGCGLGRYVFLLSRFGVDIEGLDFSKQTIDFLNQWKKENGFNNTFLEGDITHMPYESNSLSGYLSFGVIEHFIEGPQKALSEAYRILRPGGIAIITTPSKSWSQRYLKLRKYIFTILKYLIRRKVKPVPFFQYWYTPKQLEKFVKQAGFNISRYSGTDFLYSFYEFCKAHKINIEKHKHIFKFSLKLDNSIFSSLGAQSVVIAVKPGEKMHCFLCGEVTAGIESIKKFDVPVCEKHMDLQITDFYLKNSCKPRFNNQYLINTDMKQEKRICEYSKKEYYTDRIFENFGIAKSIDPKFYMDKEKSILFSNTLLQPIWRNRKKSL